MRMDAAGCYKGGLRIAINVQEQHPCMVLLERERVAWRQREH